MRGLPAGRGAIVLRHPAEELDHPNLVPLVVMAIAVSALAHLFPDGTFGWLKQRFIALPRPVKGLILAGSALVLRELANPHYVPFIYFQF